MLAAVIAEVPAPASSQPIITELTGPVYGGKQSSLKYVSKIN